MRVLVTAGGTQNPIDDVRWIGNFSTGNFGSQISLAFLRRGHQVSLLHSRLAIVPHRVELDLTGELHKQWQQARLRADEWENLGQNYRAEMFDTVDAYTRKLRRLAGDLQPDVVILAAAVSDYSTVPRAGKISSDAEKLSIELHRTPKVIAAVREWLPSTYLIGFKLLSGAREEDLLAAARQSLTANRADLVVANDLQSLLRDNHTIHLVRPDASVERYSARELAHAGEVTLAEQLADRVLQWSKEKQLNG